MVSDLASRIPMRISDPKFLYKYKRLNDSSLAILSEKKIWYPKPSSFNDPYDCRIRLSSNGFHKTWLKMMVAKARYEGDNPTSKKVKRALKTPYSKDMRKRSAETYVSSRVSSLRYSFHG